MRAFYFLIVFSLTISHAYGQSWEALNKQIDRLYKEEEYRTAFNVAKNALEQAEREFGKKHENYLETLIFLGRTTGKLDEFELAELYLNKAVEICKTTNEIDPIICAKALNSLALVFKNQGKLAEALSQFQIVEEIIKEEKGDGELLYADILHNLADLSMRMGQYKEAEQYLMNCLEIKKSSLGSTHPSYASTLNLKGGLSFYLRQYEEAISYWEKAKPILKKEHGDRSEQYSDILNNLAVGYMRMKLSEKAEIYYKETLEIVENIYGQEHSNVTKVLNNLGRLYQITRRYHDAEGVFKKALNITEKTLGEHHLLSAKLLNNLGLTYKLEGKYKEAEVAYQKCIAVREEVLGTNHQEYHTTLYNLARLHEAMGLFPQADSEYIKLKDIWVDQLYQYYPVLSEKEKLNFFNRLLAGKIHAFFSYGTKRIKSNANLSEEMLDLWLHIQGAAIRTSRDLRKIILQSQDSILLSHYNRWKSIRVNLAEKFSLSAKQKVEQNLLIDSLKYEANQLEKLLSRLSSNFASQFTYAGIGWKNIQEKLKDNEAAIAFVDFRIFGTRRASDTTLYGVWVIRSNDTFPHFFQLSKGHNLEKTLVVSSIKEKSLLQSKGKLLYQSIWAPFENHIKGVNTVFFTTSGLLHHIPLGALPITGGKMLMDQYNLVHLGDLRSLALKSSKSSGELKTATLFGGAIYDVEKAELTEMLGSKIPQNDHSIQINSSQNKDKGWEYLSGTEKEVRNLDTILQRFGWKVRTFIGRNASEDQLKTQSGSFAPHILHVASHGYFFSFSESSTKKNKKSWDEQIRATEQPLLRSGLVFTGANRVFLGGENVEELEDGILTAYEITSMDLQNTDLVVLSACETGLGDLYNWEGVIGLQRAFQLAGVNAILMSLWKVPDQQTTELMKIFYQKYLEGIPKSSALVYAQQEMRKKYPSNIWAGFILIENEILLKEKNSISRPLLFIMLVILLGIGFFAYKRVKRNYN